MLDTTPAAGLGGGTLDVLRSLTGQLEEAVLVVAASGTVVFVSDAASTVLGLPPDAVGRPITEVGVDYRIALLVAETHERGEAQERDLDDMPHARTMRARAVPLGGPGGHVGVVLADRTRVQRLERVRRDFVANVSHELRTPLAAIQLLAETLQHGALDDREAAADFVDRIRLEVANMTQMVEELLELTTVEVGGRPIRREHIRVADLLESVQRLRPLAEQRGIDLVVDPGEPGLELRGDLHRLGQVLRNLTHNGLKFTQSGGRVEVRATLGDAPDTVTIEVSDTGAGIAPEDLPRIFERFWKADRSRHRSGEGSGLGLAIARHVVEAHGGRIAVASTPRVGTTFTVTLPAA